MTDKRVLITGGAEFGWRPTTALKDDLVRTIGYFRALLDASDAAPARIKAARSRVA